MTLQLNQFIELVNEGFLTTYRTHLEGGHVEPFYKAPQESEIAVIQFTRDHYSSALHELAHWCIAGSERLKKDDFGYWYNPDGRSTEQQSQFFKVEIKPQAIEWAFSVVCQIEFNFSCDNLSGDSDVPDFFKNDVVYQIQRYLDHGFPPRAQRLLQFLYQKCFTEPGSCCMDHLRSIFLKRFVNLVKESSTPILSREEAPTNP